MKPHQLHTHPGVKSRKHRKTNPNVPEDLDVFLCLPAGIGSVRDYEWFPPVHSEPPARLDIRQILLRIPDSPPPSPTSEEIAVEVDRVLKLPPAEFRKWVAEQQERNDAALAAPMPWGGAR